MAIASLHSICLHRIYGFLKQGMWKYCLENPFSELPAQDVQRLIDMTLLHYPENHPKISDVILLLTSGRILCLDLCPFYLDRKQDLINHITREQGNAYRNFLSTFGPHSRKANSEKFYIFHLVRSIISANRYLEEFHSYIHPGFDIIQNCQNLRILKLYRSHGDIYFDNFPVDLSVLSSLRNLEVLHLPFMDTHTIANVLEICPNLISIGLEDSLDSMKEIHQRRQRSSSSNSEVVSHFQLRRCFWGLDLRIKDPQEKLAYHSEFCDKVRFAVTLCPFVQELIFNVQAKEAMKELKFLKQLTFLQIDFYIQESDFVREFIILLQEIGSQLRHLSIVCNRPLGISYYRVPIDDIFVFCPHLESLEIDQIIFYHRFPSEGYINFPLKRLRLSTIFEPDESEGPGQNSASLLFLLSNCKHLEELFIDAVECFDDALLSQIFERNCFTELKVVFVEDCCLTKDGYQIFIEKARSIETIFVEDLDSEDDHFFYDANRAFKDPNLHYFQNFYFYIKSKEFFRCLLDLKRF